MASYRKISMSTILKVRCLCFLLATCLYLMKIVFYFYFYHWSSTCIAYRHTMCNTWPASLDKGSGDCCFHETTCCCLPWGISHNDELFRKYVLLYGRYRSGEIVWDSVCKERGASYNVWQSSILSSESPSSSRVCPQLCATRQMHNLER